MGFASTAMGATQLGLNLVGDYMSWKGQRENAKAQANHMPRRYWQNLTEAPGSAITIQQAHRLTTPSGAAKDMIICGEKPPE